MSQKITTFLWFDAQALEAAEFYTSIFRNSHIDGVSHYAEGNREEAGKVMTVSFTLDGMEFTALNGGPVFQFTPAISLFVACESQAEVDHFWEKLGEGGKYLECGWLTDKYGISWQIVPTALMQLMNDPDPARAKRVTEKMLKMKKLIISDLEAA
jgi:predicted 3-demethylubiquinone-9 3-methyltransferase (glyoxalase superfamily)